MVNDFVKFVVSLDLVFFFLFGNRNHVAVEINMFCSEIIGFIVIFRDKIGGDVAPSEV